MSITYPEAQATGASRKPANPAVMNSGSALFPKGSTSVYERASKVRKSSSKSAPIVWIAAPIAVLVIGGGVYLASTQHPATVQKVAAVSTTTASTTTPAPVLSTTSATSASAPVQTTTRTTHTVAEKVSAPVASPAPERTVRPAAHHVTRTATSDSTTVSAPPAPVTATPAPAAATPTPGTFSYSPPAAAVTPATPAATPDTSSAASVAAPTTAPTAVTSATPPVSAPVDQPTQATPQPQG